MTETSKSSETANGNKSRRLHLRDISQDGMGAGTYDGIGIDLKATRVRAGITLEVASTDLCIRKDVIESIESGHFDALPSLVYATGFVRSYAEYLKLDPEVVVNTFKQETAAAKKETKLDFPTPTPEGSLPTGTIMLGALLAGVTLYGAWYFMNNSQQAVTSTVPQIPDRLAELAEKAPPPEPMPVEKTVEPDQEEVAPADTATAAEGTVSPESTDEAAPASTEAESAAPEAPEAAESPATTEVAAASPEPVTPAAAPAPGNPADNPAAQTAAVEAEAGRGEPVASTPIPHARPEPQPEEETTTAEAPTEEPVAPTLPEAVSAVSEAVIEEETAVAAAPAMESPVVDETTQAAPSETQAADVQAEAEATAEAAEEALAPASAAPEEANTQAEAVEEPAQVAEETEPQVPASPTISEVLNSRITIRAVSSAWVQVNATDGEVLIQKVLNKGDEYQVPDRDGLSFMTGNAGGLELVIDGKDLGALGKRGQVVTDLTLHPENLLQKLANQ